MLTLDVVNLMLGTMGERPLSSLTDSHALLPAALGKLDKCNREVQAKGWWFNMEDLTLTANPSDKNIYMPNDCMSLRTPSYNLVKRGSRVYNLTGGTFVFTVTTLCVELIRLLSFEDLPEIAAQYIAAKAVLEFQHDYDGDTAKSRQLAEERDRSKIEINIEHTRNRKSNFIDSNYRLQRLKSATRNARAGIRWA